MPPTISLMRNYHNALFGRGNAKAFPLCVSVPRFSFARDVMEIRQKCNMCGHVCELFLKSLGRMANVI